ncbi:MAG TPA: hypothetical protein VD908_10810 [Cytophagales bacterium]|nr:hypothetical protein [Cytophagales bacterium]
MTTINITIDVLNPHEIVKKKKGFFAGLLAKFFLSKEKIKQEVEKKICEKIVEELRNHINEGLSNEGVVAKVRYSYYQDEPEGSGV